jgi:hypothetical protein
MFRPNFRMSSLVAAALLSGAMAAANASGGAGTPQMAKPKLKSITVAKSSFSANEPLAFTVAFEGKQCVFNLEFISGPGSSKTQGFYFNSPSQLSLPFSQPASYWGLAAGSYTLSAVPHPNPSVAGPNAVACTGGPVSTMLNIEPPAQIITPPPQLKPAALGNATPPAPKGQAGELKGITNTKPGTTGKADPPEPDKSKLAAPPVGK